MKQCKKSPLFPRNHPTSLPSYPLLECPVKPAGGRGAPRFQSPVPFTPAWTLSLNIAVLGPPKNTRGRRVRGRASSASFEEVPIPDSDTPAPSITLALDLSRSTVFSPPYSEGKPVGTKPPRCPFTQIGIFLPTPSPLLSGPNSSFVSSLSVNRWISLLTVVVVL